MSPETTTNDHIDHRSDLFSLGVILYLLCSGYMPFTGREPKEIVKKIRAGQYKPLQEIVQVPDRLALLVGRLLSPNPDDRPQRGQEVATELTEIARQYGIESSGPSIAYVLKQLFPDEVGGPSEYQAPTVIGPQDSKSTSSLTPATTAPPTSTASIAAAVDSAAPPVPRSREFSAPVAPPTTSTSAPRPKVSGSRQFALPHAPGSAQRPVSVARVLITVAVAILLAIGMYLLVRPS